MGNQVTEQVLSFRTQTDDWVVADKDHPIRVIFDPDTREPSPYILVRDNLEALINRPLFYDLVELARHVKSGAKTRLEISSQGTIFTIGEI